MAERNFMNVNDVYPILDMINRKVNQKKGTSYQFESPLLNDGTGSGGSLDSSQWQVESFEVTRDTANTIDPNVIKDVTIVYRNGAIDTISLKRGLNPPVPSTVSDAEYINNLMIVEVGIHTELFGRTQGVTATIFKENGYGNFQKVELAYDDSDWDEIEVLEDDIESYDNPNDFYDGGSSDEGYDSEVDDAEDYAETEYLPEDEVEVSEDGWADGYNPSQPIDIPLEEAIEVAEDFSETEYLPEDDPEYEE